MSGQPLGTALDVARALRLRTDAGKADELFQIGDEFLSSSASIAERSPQVHSSWPRISWFASRESWPERRVRAHPGPGVLQTAPPHLRNVALYSSTSCAMTVLALASMM